MDFTLLGLWHEMGPIARGVVVVLLVMSMYAFGITVERFFSLRKGRRLSLAYVRSIAPLVAATGKLREAAGLETRFDGSPVARVIGAGLKEWTRATQAEADRQKARGGEPRPQTAYDARFDRADAVSRTLERVKDRELAGLRRGLSVLATVSSSAPFVGLFGTVGGIITAFQKLADPAKGGGGIGTVSAGIAEALITTAVGLAVAIISVWFYNYFIARVDDITIDIDETASELVDSVLREETN
jgi:biopolymer transport protein ExbB/TolQ